MQYQFDRAREAVSKGQHDRASFIIGEIEKEVPYKVSGNSFASIRGKYNNKALHEVEKLYSYGLIKNLMTKATSEGDFKTLDTLQEMYRLSNQNSMSYADSVAFSRKVYSIHENAKFMPMKNAVNSDSMHEIYNLKNKSVKEDTLISELQLDKFLKGGVSGVMGIANDIKNIGSAGGFLVSKLAKTKKGQDFFRKMSEANLDPYAGDEDSGSTVFKAGQIAPLVAEILYSGGSRAIAKVPAFTKGFAKAFASSMAKASGKSLSVVGVGHAAGMAARFAGEQVELDEVTIRGAESSARLYAMRALHDWFVKPSSQVQAEQEIVNTNRRIANSVSEQLSEITEENSRQINKVIEDNNIGKSQYNKDIAPVKDTSGETQFKTSTKADSYGKPEFVNEVTGEVHTINDIVKYDTELQKDGFVKTSNLPTNEDVKPYALASLDNSIVEDIKLVSDGGNFVPEISATDSVLITKSIDERALNPLQIGAIAEDSNNINLISLLEPDLASEMYKIKTLSQDLAREDFSSHDLASRRAVIKQWGVQSGFDQSLLNSFLGTLGRDNVAMGILAEHKGQIATEVQNLSKILSNRNKSKIYSKFNPILDQFDYKNESYITKTRSQLLDSFNELLSDPSAEYAFNEISETYKNSKTLKFETVDGQRVPSGAFVTTIEDLLRGDDVSFYQGLKQARTILSKNNEYGYQAPVPKGVSSPQKQSLKMVREKLIDPIYDAMVKVKKSMLSESEVNEYNQGEKYFKGIKDTEVRTIDEIIDYDTRRPGKTPEKLYKKFVTNPQFNRYLQKISYTQTEFPETQAWVDLKANGIVDQNSTPFIAMQTALVLEQLGGLLNAGGSRIHEGLAGFKKGINAPLNLRGTRLKETLNENQVKAFDMLVTGDVRYRQIRLNSESDKFFAQTIQDNIVNPKISPSVKAVFMTLLKKGGFKAFMPVLKALNKELSEGSRKENIASYMKEMANMIRGNILTKDAIKNAIINKGNE